LRFAGRSVLPHVTNDSDDRHGFKRIVRGDDYTTHRVSPTEGSPRKRLVDNHDARSPCDVTVRKLPPPHDGGAEHLEGSRRDHVHGGGTCGLQRCLLRHPIDPIAAIRIDASWWSHHGSGRQNAWKLPDVREQRLKERPAVAPIAFAWACRG